MVKKNFSETFVSDESSVSERVTVKRTGGNKEREWLRNRKGPTRKK